VRNGDAQWVNYTLSTEEKNAFKASLADNPAAYSNELETMMQEGYRFSVRWDDYATCFAVTLYDNSADGPNKGMLLSSRSPSWETALSMCLYKHLVIFDRRWASGLLQANGDFEG
jgi:hypothetical protein